MLQIQHQFQCLLLILASGLLDNKIELSNCHELLSSRECEVLSYLACGSTAKQIGLLLGISRRTVEHHIENIKLKTCCASKAELIALCWSGC